MNNNKIALYKGNHSSGIVKSNDDNNQTDIIPSNQDSEIDYLSRLTPEQLLECKKIHNNALVYIGDHARHNKDLSLSNEDRVKIAAATKAEEKQRTGYLKQDGILQVRFSNESQSKRTKSKKKSAKEEQQIATDNLILELKTQRQVVKDYLAHERLGEPEREMIKDILDEEANEDSTTEDIEPILRNYLIYLNQKIESLDQVSRDSNYRQRIHLKQAYKRGRARKDENVQAILSGASGKVPTHETIAKVIIERDNDTKAKELLALNQYEGNIAELIEVFVIPIGQIAMGEYYDQVQMMLVPIDADIEEFVAVQNPDLVPYLHPAYEETNNRYALTAFSPVNYLTVDISKDENNILSTDGFDGNRSTNPNNQLLLEQAQSNVVEAKLLSSAASDIKLLPVADSGDNDSNNSQAIVLADNKNTSALDIVPESVSVLNELETNEEVLSLTITNPVGVLNAIIIEENLEERNKNGYIVKSSGEEVFHSSCKNLASKVIRNTQKIEPLFFGQLVEGDSSYYDRVNDVTRVYIANTGETVTYEGLVKLERFASESEIAVDEDKVLEATIRDVANVAQITKYDGPSLQLLKNKYQLTVAIAQDIIRTYWNIEQNNQTRANNTVLSDEEYEAYCQSKNYGKESNIICESDLLSVSESSVESLRHFFEFEYIDDGESTKSIAIKELETLLSAINTEQAEILDTPPEEIPNLIEAITLKSNEVEDIVNQILQDHFQCDANKAREILALYPSVETVLDIGTEKDELGNETFNLPSDIWTNEDYRYEEWNGQRDLLPFPTKQEYEKFVGFIRNIKGDDKHLKWDSFLLMMNLEKTLDLLNSQDLDAAREIKTQIDNKAQAQAQRKIEESVGLEEVVIEELSSQSPELPDVDIQANNDSETELDDPDLVDSIDPKINVTQEDMQILERILQKKINDQKMAMKDRMVWAKYFESVSYESVEAEAISRKIEQVKALLF